MNNSLENLTLRKQLLQARSTLCRLRVRCEVNAMRDRLSWARVGVRAAKVLPVRSAVLGLALYAVPHSQLVRLFALAARLLLLTRLASIVTSMLQKPPALPPSVRERTDRVVIDL